MDTIKVNLPKYPTKTDKRVSSSIKVEMFWYKLPGVNAIREYILDSISFLSSPFKSGFRKNAHSL